MYSTNFLKNPSYYSLDRLKLNRTCFTCGNKIKKGSIAFFDHRSTRRFVMCTNCAAEIYYIAEHIPIKSTPEQEEIAKEFIKKELELHVSDRVDSLLKEYSAERIIKEVLKRAEERS